MSQLPPDPLGDRLRALQEQSRQQQAAFRESKRQREEEAAATKRLKDEEAARAAGLKNLKDVIQDIGRTATVSFAAASVSLGGLTRAASGATWSTLTNSIDMLAGSIGSSLVPFMAQLAFRIQSVSDWVSKLDPALTANIAGWAMWTAGGLGAITVVAKIISTGKEMIPVFTGLGKAMMFLTTNPFGIALLGAIALGAAVGALAGAFGGVALNIDAVNSKVTQQKALMDKLASGAPVENAELMKLLSAEEKRQLTLAPTSEARKGLLQEFAKKADVNTGPNALMDKEKTAANIRAEIDKEADLGQTDYGGLMNKYSAAARYERRRAAIERGLLQSGYLPDAAAGESRHMADQLTGPGGKNFIGGTISKGTLSSDDMDAIANSMTTGARGDKLKSEAIAAALKQGLDPITGQPMGGPRPLISAPREMNASLGSVEGARSGLQLALSNMSGFDQVKMAQERTNYLKLIAEQNKKQIELLEGIKDKDSAWIGR